MQSQTTSRPAEAAADRVVPFRFWDDDDILRKIVLEFTYRFDDVLDPAKLKSSLDRLLEIGDWNNMGARFKKNAAGKYEYHIPAQFDESRPGFLWSQDKFEQSIQEHPLASRIPANLDLERPTLFPGADIFHELVTSEGHATKFSDWLDRDRPALSVHVVSFNDATLLTISWSHVFLDALGRQALLQAWTAVLDGREQDVPEFVPLNVDPAEDIAQGGDPTKHVLYASVLTGMWFVLLVASFLYELVVHRKESGRMICLPGPWVESLRRKAINEARDKQPENKDFFLSHGDVLLAWWTKVSSAAQNLGPNQPINIFNVTNCRGLFPDQLPANDGVVYTSNALAASHTFLTCGEIASMSVGELASRLRQDLQEQRTTEQVRHFIAWQFESKQKYGRKPILGSWNQTMMGWSNWHRGRFYEMDFSAAIVKSEGAVHEARANKPGRPSAILPNGHVDGLPGRNSGPLLGRDAKGNWWLQWVLRDEAWARIDIDSDHWIA